MNPDATSEMHPLMACGHSANATCSHQGGTDHNQPIPACAICGCVTVAEAPADLANRTARCTYYGTKGHRRDSLTCQGEVPSDLRLAFFEHHLTKEFDEFYCGCRGWD